MYRLALKMAWASLVQRATRSFMVVMMICVSLWGLLLMQGIYDGMTEQMISNAIRSDSGELSLFGRGYRLDPTLDKLVAATGEDEKKLKNLLDKDSRIDSYVQRLRQNGLVATANYSRNTEIYGVNLEYEKGHGQLQNYLLQGEYGFGKQQKGAIIGFKLAEKLQVTIGKKIILSAQDSQSEVTSVALRVTGIIKTNNMVLDESAVFMDIGKARTFLGVTQGVSQIAIMLVDDKFIPTLQQDLQQAFPRLDILRWDEMYPALMQSRVIMKGFSLVVSIMIFGVAGLGIFGVMLVSVLERMREFGIMLAIGTAFGQVRIIVLAESLCMGLSGFIAGAVCGLCSLVYFKRYGLDLTMFSDAFEEFGMDAVTYAIIRTDYFLTAFAAVTFATLVSVYFPLRMLKKTKPIEVINEG
ncbi:MAG: ABC transporter permease [Desulfocapsa sp.]|nr:ABC transporter permease [Desulfocapsa sp.]